ncbi:hypothetical protein TYRP_010146 [Tyrophagus putrescentiae]|nr:hypothetical protein TYRP_010146 [Tyrophagus putrescentiae]
MDESLNPISSQNTDFAIPFNSTSVLDGTMPDLLDSTIPNSQHEKVFDDKQRSCENLSEQQSKKIIDSVKANQRLIGSINKLLETVKTDKQFAESVKSDQVRKILSTIREKINKNISELEKGQLGLPGPSSSSSGMVLSVKNPPPTAPKPKMPALSLRNPTGGSYSDNKENA